MDHDKIVDRVNALSACGVLVLDTRDHIIYASGVASDKLLPGQMVSDGYSLAKLNLPNEVLAQLSYNSKTSLSSGKRRSISAVVPILNRPHLWAFTFNPSFDDSGRPEAVIISAYDTGGTACEGREQNCSSALPNRSQIPFLPGSLVAVKRDDLTVTFMNYTALASLGATKEDVLGKVISEVLPSSSSGLVEELEKVASSGEAIIRTESICLRNMDVRYLRWMITASSNPEEMKLNLMFSDATDQVSDRFREMSAGIFHERQMLRTIIDTIPVGLIIVESNGSIWLSNELANRLWSTGGEDGLRTIHSLEGYDECDQKLDLHEWPLYKALHYGAISSGKVIRVHCPSGETRVVLSSAAPLRSEDGSFLGAISVFHDITDQKVVEERMIEQSEALKRSNEELQQFAYVASHDLKEPLRMVLNYVFLLRKHLAGKMDERDLEYMHYATEGATRMKEMIDRLLEYSRVEKGGEMFGQVDMGEVVDGVIKDLQVSISESGAQISHGSMPKVTAIGAQMVQLVENLVSNAIKFRTESPPRIEISARLNGDVWLFWVKDNGIGIDEKYGDQIFTMFQRLHTREEYEGTGMGLALARRIVEHHGGRIWFESEVGKGSTFYFTIPVDHRPKDNWSFPDPRQG